MCYNEDVWKVPIKVVGNLLSFNSIAIFLRGHFISEHKLSRLNLYLRASNRLQTKFQIFILDAILEQDQKLTWLPKQLSIRFRACLR